MKKNQSGKIRVNEITFVLISRVILKEIHMNFILSTVQYGFETIMRESFH